MKITEAQRVVFCRFVYGHVKVFALFESPKTWNAPSRVRHCDGIDKVNLKTAKALLRKGLCQYVDIIIEGCDWYGIELTDKGVAFALLLRMNEKILRVINWLKRKHGAAVVMIKASK